jgi:hypothetical protein
MLDTPLVRKREYTPFENSKGRSLSPLEYTEYTLHSTLSHYSLFFCSFLKSSYFFKVLLHFYCGVCVVPLFGQVCKIVLTENILRVAKKWPKAVFPT